MNFSQFLLILKARKKVLIATFLLAVVTTAAISLLLPKTYKATTTLVLNYKGVDPVTGLTLPAQLMPGYMATQVDIITSTSVALNVVDTLNLAAGEQIRQEFLEDADGKGDIRQWLATLLLKRIEVIPSRDSSVLNISFRGANPEFAAAVSNAFAAEYQRTTIHLKTDPLKNASGYFNDQRKTLRANIETAQNKLSKYQREKGIVSVDNRLDVESSRLNELSSQLVIVQNQLMDASSRQRQALVNSHGEAPDVMANPLIQNLKASLAQAEAKFAQVAERLGVNHPQYQANKAEVEKLRSELSRNIKTTTNNISSNARILQQRESELQTAVNRQKEKLLELNQARDEITVMVKDVESAQHAYDASMQRLNQTSIEGQANQTEAMVLNPAVPPITPSSPKLVLNVVLAMFLGISFGTGFCLLAENMDRRVRSVKDLADTLQVPVLGTIRGRGGKHMHRGLATATPLA